MFYDFSKDIESIREILGITQSQLASDIGVEQVTISRNELNKTVPSYNTMEKVYSYAFSKKIYLGKLKQMFWKETIDCSHKLLFHGAKSLITTDISVHRSRSNNDFGKGFYTGESYEQTISFVSGFAKSCLYFIDFDPTDLICKKYNVDQEWMMTIAYYRGALSEYENHPMILNLINNSRNCDYIIAPIADNRMFQIINSFIAGEITDEQCKHCLAATNLGYQFVFISDRSIKNIKLLEQAYLSNNEKKYYSQRRSSESKLGDDKVKLAKRQYRGKGLYIDEILI